MLADGHCQRVVDGKHTDRRSSDRSPSPQTWAVPFKVPSPTVSARIEQAAQGFSVRINACVGAFVNIARKTRKSEVLQFSPAAMLLGDNMIELKRPLGVRARDAAVFALFARAANKLPARWPCSKGLIPLVQFR
jgi:hypothetical protein